MNLFELGQALKRTRLRLLLTQRDLAMRTGVSLSTISGLERGTLAEIGVVKLIQLFSVADMELRPVSVGQRRTLDDIQAEKMQKISAAQEGKYRSLKTPEKFNVEQSGSVSDVASDRQRVRHSKKKNKK